MDFTSLEIYRPVHAIDIVYVYINGEGIQWVSIYL